MSGGGGGYYTQEQYKEIVDYARSRYVTIVPEIDTPGHTNAALASYPELNSSEEAPALYEGTQVGFSTLWINSEITYQFLNDVIRELAALDTRRHIFTSAVMKPDLLLKRITNTSSSACRKLSSHTAKSQLAGPRSVKLKFCRAPSRRSGSARAIREQNDRAQRSSFRPANKTYLDMKYDNASPLGLDWAGLISVKDSYDWEPGSYMDGLEESDILGHRSAAMDRNVQYHEGY